jgi:thiosulfate reductase cytochrome b subunit
VSLLHALFAISGGLVAGVAGLLHVHFAALFRLLGCGSLVVALEL